MRRPRRCSCVQGKVTTRPAVLKSHRHLLRCVVVDDTLLASMLAFATDNYWRANGQAVFVGHDRRRGGSWRRRGFFGGCGGLWAL